jgi:chromosome segregation ATPase
MNRKVGRTTQPSRPAQGTPLQQVFQVAQFHEQRLNRLEANNNNLQTSTNVGAKIQLIQSSLQSLSETVNTITLNLNASNENMDKVANGLNSNNKTLMGSEAAIAVLQERISLLETEISKLKEENKHTIHTGGKISLTIDEAPGDEDEDKDDDDDEEEEGQ